VLGAVLVAGALAWVKGPAATCAGLVLALALLVLSGLPMGFVVRRLSKLNCFLLPFLLVFPAMCEGHAVARLGPVTVSDRGLALGFVIYGKALALVALSLVMLNTGRFSETLWALERLGMPRALRQLALMTVRYLPILVEELNTIRSAAVARACRLGANTRSMSVAAGMAGSILTRSVLRSDRVWNAMRCRGFEGRFHTLQRRRVRMVDALGLVIAAGVAAGLILLDLR
jgi:cobalt/nickel transport system permease protein